MTETRRTASPWWVQIRAIALNTFREGVRSRIFYILFAFAVAMILFSAVMGVLTIGSRSKIILDLGLTFISFFTVMTAIFVGIGLVYQEVERKTIYNVLSKPVSRTRFLLGRYLGLMSLLAANLAAMILLLAAVLLLFRGFTWKILLAAGFIYLELAIITAIALFFSSITSPVVSALCTGAFYIVGHTSSALPDMLVPRLESEAMKRAVTGLYHVLPDLNLLNLTNQVAYEIPIPAGFVWKSAAYSILLVAALLAGACLLFSRRDLV